MRKIIKGDGEIIIVFSDTFSYSYPNDDSND